MKKALFLVAAVAFAAYVLFLAGSTQALAGPYTFDSDNQAWQATTVGYNGINYERLYPNTPANWTGAFGVGFPDGSIYQSSNGTAMESRPYWMGTRWITPATALGDLTGKTLQAYVRSTANWTGGVPTDTVYLRWTIATEYGDGSTSNMWVSKSAVSINLNDVAFGAGADTDWVLQSISMIESNFFKWPNGSAPGAFADVLLNYTSFGLQISPTAFGSDALNNFNGSSGTWGSGYTLLHYGATAKSGNATWGVDGFQTVPEPSTALLLGLAVIGLAGMLRKIKSKR